MIGGKPPECVLERKDRIISTDLATRGATQLLELRENLAQALVSLHARLVCGRGQPFETRGQSGCDDEDFVSGVDQLSNTKRKILGATRRLTYRD